MRRPRRRSEPPRPAEERPAPAAADVSDGTRHAGQPRAGGYRLVRSLGEGRSAVVHLGYADTATEDEPRRTAAVKIYRTGVSAERIDAEVAALAAVEHPHVVRLVDIATAPDGRPCLVVERCAAGTLAGLVANRSNLAAGEAVTILAPIVAALDALHAAGFVHRDIRLSRVLFRESGSPVLAGLGRAERIPAGLSPAALAAHRAVLDDRSQLARLVGAVLERVDGSGARAVESWLEGAPWSADDFSPRLSDRLFDLAEPQPVRMRDDGSLPVRLGEHRRPTPVVGRTPESEQSAVGRRVASAARALVDRARGVRSRAWIAAGVVSVSLLVAALAVPRDSPVAGDEAATAGATPTPHDPGPIPAEDGPSRDVVLGDDPLAAIGVLLDERDRCLREISVVCLDSVAQPGSAALQHDVAIVRRLQAGGERSPDDTIRVERPVLVERLGDSALLDLGDVPHTQPASALVMRAEAGWRIRDYLDE